jgi:hypothetical protein
VVSVKRLLLLELINFKLFFILGVAIPLFVIISVIKRANSNSAKISIPVLCFEDYSPESEIKWFCNGITKEIITKISGVKK